MQNNSSQDISRDKTEENEQHSAALLVMESLDFLTFSDVLCMYTEHNTYFQLPSHTFKKIEIYYNKNT